jgi:hypothetical protein
MSRGRPSKINQVVRVRADGTEITAADQVIERIQLGLDLQSAADSAGISRQTLHNWRLQGARRRAEAANGKRLTPAQQRYVDFLDALERAEAEAEANRLAIISRTAQGGATVRKVTRKIQRVQDDTGTWSEVELERTEVEETLRPEWTAAAWWLERRMPGKYARRVEVTGAEGQPLVPQDDQARGLADSLRDYLAGAAAGAEVAAEKADAG